jgi:hypothetical protein
MKKHALCSVMILFSAMLFSQDYYPLVGENKVWNVLNVYYETFEPPIDTGYITITYKISGDSVIDNVTYKKVYRTEEEFPANWTFIRLIREDENKKVYLRMFDEDILYYDFSVDPGDTVTIGTNTYQVTLITDSVGYVEISGMLLKKIWLRYEQDPSLRESWIEGIGSNLGLMQMGMAGTLGGWYWFSCLTENGTLVYMNPAIVDCYMFGTGMNETVLVNRLTLFPNPASSFITINTKEGIPIEEAIIYNHLGLKVLTTKLVNNKVDVSGLNAGMYVMEAKVNENSVRIKFIKQ